MTPLHIASAAGQEDVVGALLLAKADSLAKDTRGRTPLHWAAVAGHGSTIESLLSCSRESWPEEIKQYGLAAVPDSHGYLPIALAPDELLRFCLSGHDRCLQGDEVEIGRASIPGESGAAGIYRYELDRDERPVYRRSTGPGWAICWDSQTSRWGLYRERYDAACIQYQSSRNTLRCPADGWEAVSAQEPIPSFEEVLPWRGGCSLFEATPDNLKLKPHELKKVLESLPSLRPMRGLAKQPTALRVGDTTIPLPEGVASLQALIREMIRRGDLPPEPPPGCLQQ